LAGTPTELPGTPTDLPGVPTGLPGVPTELPGVPTELPGVPTELPGLPGGLAGRRGGQARIRGYRRGHDRDRLGALLVDVRRRPPRRPLPLKPRVAPHAQRLLPHRPAARPGRAAGRRPAAGPCAPASRPSPRRGFIPDPRAAPGIRAIRHEDPPGSGCRAGVRLVACCRQAQPARTRGIDPTGIATESWCAAEGGDDPAQRPRRNGEAGASGGTSVLAH
jgi:hypothetical protein